MKKPTIADVAARAGVSRSTVSYALSHKRTISASTRARILAAIDELGYVPDPIAIRLASRETTRNIGVIIPFTRPNIAALEMKFFSGAFNVINENDYTFILIDYTDRNLTNVQRFASSRLVDGFIMLEMHLYDRRVNVLQQANIPFVMVGRCADNTGLAFVDNDIHTGMKQIFQHLVGLGHRSIAFIHKDDPDFTFEAVSLEGYQEASRLFDLEPVVRTCELTPEDGRRVMEKLLDEHPAVTAVYVWSDIPTLGVIEAVQARGLQIPAHFNVVCQEHSIISSLPSFQASYLDIRAEELTSNAARLLIDLIENKPVAETQILLKPRLVVKS